MSTLAGGEKDKANKEILRVVQNATPSDNTIKQIVWQAHQHCYKDVATNLESGMPLASVFDKGERGGLGRLIKEEIMFDHSVDKIIPIRLNSDGAEGKDIESAKAIDATLCDVYIYYKDSKRTKAVRQCTKSIGVGVTEGASAGLSAVKRQYNMVYYVSTCVLHAASKFYKIPWRRLLMSRGWERRNSRNFFTLAGLSRKLSERTLKWNGNPITQASLLGASYYWSPKLA